MTTYLLAIDQGTTNSRAIIFNAAGELISLHEIPLKQYFPQNGWVEQSPQEIVRNSIQCMRAALQKAKLRADDIQAIGITNQRETTIIWDKKTGEPIYPAIVWQDRRTSALCETLRTSTFANEFREKTGLLLDPYFSATKIIWLLDNITGARARAENGELAFGTVDSYLLWHLTAGRSHKTDATNASRTLLFNIRENRWDATLLDNLQIPAVLLPGVEDSTSFFGECDEKILGRRIPITGIAGDQHAATFGQACFQPGMIKVTYGTGGFMVINTGNEIARSHQHLLSTVAYRVQQQSTYAIEGSIFSAGATIKWLRDKLQVIPTAADSETAARSVDSNGGVYFVPAFTGLGAPYWDPHARGAILGLTQGSHRNHIVRAGLESVCYQTKDLLGAIAKDCQNKIATLRVDGGMVVNNWFLQFLANILQMPVERPHCIQTTALGAAYLAGLQQGVYQTLSDIENLWQLEGRFEPTISADEAIQLYSEWQAAVKRVM